MIDKYFVMFVYMEKRMQVEYEFWYDDKGRISKVPLIDVVGYDEEE